MPASPPPKRTQARGALHRVPCPTCGRTNDFRGLAATDGTTGFGSYGLEAGTVCECDHCHRKMRIVAVHNIIALTVVRA